MLDNSPSRSYPIKRMQLVNKVNLFIKRRQNCFSEVGIQLSCILAMFRKSVSIFLHNQKAQVANSLVTRKVSFRSRFFGAGFDFCFICLTQTVLLLYSSGSVQSIIGLFPPCMPFPPEIVCVFPPSYQNLSKIKIIGE